MWGLRFGPSLIWGLSFLTLKWGEGSFPVHCPMQDEGG